MKVQFLETECVVSAQRYATNNRIALELFDQEGDPMAMATVNLPDVPLPEGHVFIKDWSENEGILAALQEAKVIGPTIRVVNAGFTHAHECALLMAIPDPAAPKLSGEELRKAEWGSYPKVIKNITVADRPERHPMITCGKCSFSSRHPQHFIFVSPPVCMVCDSGL